MVDERRGVVGVVRRGALEMGDKLSLGKAFSSFSTPGEEKLFLSGEDPPTLLCGHRRIKHEKIFPLLVLSVPY